jgi:hypothetical protein
MKRILFVGLVSGATACLGGCANFVESRVVSAFAADLRSEDLADLRQLSSDEFAREALRHDKAIDSLKLLKVPMGEPKVVKVSDEAPNAKDVVVEVGDAKQKLHFKLVRDPDKRKWVVDDIYKSKQDVSKGTTIAQQMDVLLSVREVLDAFESGDRRRILATTTDGLGRTLSDLPPHCLAALARKAIDETVKQSGIQPRLEVGEDVAHVRLPQSGGEIEITFQRVGERWLIEDVSREARQEANRLASLRDAAAVTSVAVAFQAAYQSHDKKRLAEVSTARLFDGCLAAADLTFVSLPTAASPDKFEVKLEPRSASFVVNGKSEILRLSLLQQSSGRTGETAYRVEEVTLYELNGTQDKRLSALFNSHAVMQAFSESLNLRDLGKVRLHASPDFNRRVWDRLTPSTLEALPTRELQPATPHVVNTVFRGAVTEVTVTQGTGPRTYVLRDQSGRMVVDDIEVPAQDRPRSLKATLDLLIPIQEFAAGVRTETVDIVRWQTSRDFGRMVWNNVDSVPDMDFPINTFLRFPVKQMTVSPDRALVLLGDDTFGAKVLLVKEQDRYVVDDVVLVSGPELDQRVGLKHHLRVRLAQGN